MLYNSVMKELFSLRVFKELKVYEWLIIIVVSLAQLLIAIFSHNTVINYFIFLFGFLYIVLAAHRSFWLFIVGSLQPLLYAYVCFTAGVYGEFFVNICYFFPIQIVGFLLWKEQESKAGVIEVKKLNRIQWFYGVICSAIGWLVVFLILSGINGQQVPIIDSIITVGCILGTLLCTLRYRENWWIYIVVNVLSVSLWLILFIKGNPDGLSMCITFSAYIFYSIIGITKWKNSK